MVARETERNGQIARDARKAIGHPPGLTTDGKPLDGSGLWGAVAAMQKDLGVLMEWFKGLDHKRSTTRHWVWRRLEPLIDAALLGGAVLLVEYLIKHFH